MISIDEALGLVLANLPVPTTEEVRLLDALGRVLVEDLVATDDIPPYRRSVMDGYAVRSTDTEAAPVELVCVGEVRAGAANPGVIGPGETMMIMTGAPVPGGADAVQKVEKTERSADGDKVILLKGVKPGENIAKPGFEAKAGEIVLEAGRLIGPPEIGILASFGHVRVKVWRRPRVATFATGDELVEVQMTPGAGRIRNSNAYSLSGQLRQMGLEGEYLGIARDEVEELRSFVRQGLERDILIVTGGVSIGKYDLVKDVLEYEGFKVLFSKVAMKPGKPTVFARKGEKLAFGLPGNPVSAFVAFEVFVRPALGRLCGLARPELPRIRGELLRDLRQKPGRSALLPAWISWQPEGWKIDPLEWKGSADIFRFSRANGVVVFPAERDFMAKREVVEAVLFPDYFLRSAQAPAMDD